MKKQKQILAQCYHCGNKGLQSVIGSHKKDYGKELFDLLGYVMDIDMNEVYYWYMLVCPICGRVSLYEESTNEALPEQIKKNVIYPYNRNNFDKVPIDIKNAFESAVIVKEKDIALCFIALRKTLELICKDKGAVKGNLQSKINQLIENNILPEGLNNICWIIRQLGNMGAHGAKSSLYHYKVEQVIDFLELIISYLYILPIRAADLKASIDALEHGKYKETKPVKEIKMKNLQEKTQ